ncbi:MAG: plasmid partitioning protein RepA [Rickettsiales bacterium]|jgi:chromosome partitioning protein|nr:plasmid partitioning protein RepA [Rickettsiales bacterium]
MSEAVISENTYVIVVGNEKGGAGKTTTAMHLITSLLELGFRVGSVDLDARQRSLSRYVENRRGIIKEKGLDIPLPSHGVIRKSPFPLQADAERDEKDRLVECLSKLSEQSDFLVIDTPGSDGYLSRVAHSYADMVITPINDSFIDLDVLAHIHKDTLDIERPGVYSELIWEQKIQRAKRAKKEIEWVVVRNRLSNLDAHNKRRMTDALEKLARRIGFRVNPGFSERVIFRELFLQGLTLLDLTKEGTDIAFSLSHVAARQELRAFLEGLKIPKVEERLNPSKQMEGEKGIKKEELRVISNPRTPLKSSLPSREQKITALSSLEAEPMAV